MNHFIYAMNSADPAPATGGDTKSWFEYYKWDVDDFTYVPVPEAALIGFDLQGAGLDVLWFVMDQIILGCVPIHAILPAFSGNMELHYTTKLIQVAPLGALTMKTTETTGRASDQNLFTVLKRSFDAQYPARDQELALGIGSVQSNATETGST